MCFLRFSKRKDVDDCDLYYFKDKGSIKITSKFEALVRTPFFWSNRLNFDKICIIHKHLRSSFGAERKFLKKFTEANFSNLVSYLLYAYQKKSTEKLLAKSILWAKLDMRILQRLALNTTILVTI